MIAEYMASLGSRHGLTKYTLPNGVEITLNDDELQELFEGSKLGSDIEILKAENMKLAHQKENDEFREMQIIKQVEDSGNIGPIAGTIGNMHVTEILKYLAGHDNLNINRFAEIDLLNLVVEWRHFNKKENYFVYTNTLEVDIQIEEFDKITDIYNCQFSDDSLIILNGDF